jgi:transposase-like protein
MAQEAGSKRGQKHVYTDEFRRSVVDHLLASGKTAAQVAKEFGISAGNLRQWKERYGSAARPADADTPKTPEQLARENQELRQELARIILQRDILKKTIVIVSELSNKNIV